MRHRASAAHRQAFETGLGAGVPNSPGAYLDACQGGCEGPLGQRPVTAAQLQGPPRPPWRAVQPSFWPWTWGSRIAQQVGRKRPSKAKFELCQPFGDLAEKQEAVGAAELAAAAVLRRVPVLIP